MYYSMCVLYVGLILGFIMDVWFIVLPEFIIGIEVYYGVYYWYLLLLGVMGIYYWIVEYYVSLLFSSGINRSELLSIYYRWVIDCSRIIGDDYCIDCSRIIGDILGIIYYVLWFNGGCIVLWFIGYCIVLWFIIVYW